MLRRGLGPAAAAVLCLALAACAGPTAGADATSTSSPTATADHSLGLTAVAFRLREDEAVGGRFQVKVSNDGPEPVAISAVALTGPALMQEPATPRSTVLQPGARVDLPVRHGPAVCERSATDVEALLTIEQDGAQRTVRLPLAGTEASDATLRRIHDESCDAQRIGAVARVSLQPGVPTPDASGIVLPATLVLDRQGDGQAVLTATQVGGSVLYGLSAQPEALPATLAAGQARLEIPVLVRSTRCSGHVLGEVKKPYDFGVWLSLDGVDEQWTKVQTSPEAQAALRAYLAEACGLE